MNGSSIHCDDAGKEEMRPPLVNGKVRTGDVRQ